jgi:hypothetical protein
VKRAAVVLALGAGCVEIPDPSVPPCEPGDDLDGDGWTCDGIVPDCNDLSGVINPGAEDWIGDDSDSDCIGGDRTLEDELDGATIDEGGAIVRTRDLEIRFPETAGGQPGSIREQATGLELLALGGLGVAATPGFDTSADGSSTRTVVHEGPAVVEIVVDWTAPTPPATVAGSTRFRILPYDRIVRTDRVELDVALPEPGPYDLGVFAVFSPERYNRVDWHLNDAFEPLTFADAGTTPYLGGESEPGWACFVHGSGIREIGFVWMDTGPIGARVAIGPDGLVFGYDWARAAASIGGEIYWATTLLATGRASDGACGDTLGQSEDLLAPEPFAATSGGGVVIGFDPGIGAYRASSDGDYVELRVQTAPVHHGVLIEAQLQSEPVFGVTVWHDRVRMQRGVDYHVQAGPDGGVTVWLATPLDDGDVIRIAAPGGEEPGG